MSIRIRTIVVALLTSLTAALDAHASSPHVRGLSECTRLLIQRGIAESPSFRALVQRLNRSDVVVYVSEDRFQSKLLAGRLTFLTAAGGYRYVRARLRWPGHERQQIAALAHELQHAIEIAERPDIVDQDSLARAFLELGDQRPSAYGAAAVFETAAAVEAGDKVWREVAGPEQSGD